MSWGDATLPELLWTLVAIAGLVVSARSLDEAMLTRWELDVARANGARRIIARGNVRSEAMRLAIQAIYGLLGLLALVTPPANPQTPVSGYSLLVSGGLILSSLLLNVKTVLAGRDRRRLIALLTERFEREEAHG